MFGVQCGPYSGENCFGFSCSVREIANGCMVTISDSNGRATDTFFPPDKCRNIPLYVCEILAGAMADRANTTP